MENVNNKLKDLSAFFAFLSLIIFSIRIKGVDQSNLGILVENLFIFFSLILFPWKIKEVIKVCIILIVFIFHTAITFGLLIKNIDSNLMLNNISRFLKALSYSYLFYSFSWNVIRRYGFVSISIVVAVHFFRLFSGEFTSVGDGFTAGFGDRNYFALCDSMYILMLALSIKKNISKTVIENLWFGLLFFIVTIMVLFSGSRSGLLALILVTIFISWRMVCFYIPVLFLLIFYTSAGDFLLFRVETLTSDGEYIRLAQLHAAANEVQNNPISILTGFGLMASSQISWIAKAYEYLNMLRYVSIIHNTTIDFIFSFGLIGLFILGWLIKRVKLFASVFLIVTTSFINCLVFPPLYLLIGLFLKAD